MTEPSSSDVEASSRANAEKTRLADGKGTYVLVPQGMVWTGLLLHLALIAFALYLMIVRLGGREQQSLFVGAWFLVIGGMHARRDLCDLTRLRFREESESVELLSLIRSRVVAIADIASLERTPYRRRSGPRGEITLRSGEKIGVPWGPAIAMLAERVRGPGVG